MYINVVVISADG